MFYVAPIVMFGIIFEFICLFFLSARVLGKHHGTVPPRPNVPPENLVASGPEQLSAAEVNRRMKLLREDR